MAIDKQRIINIVRDKLIPFADVPNMLPKKNGKKLNLSTIYRWHQRGLKGVRLEAVQYGGTLATTEVALNQFFHDLTAATEGRKPVIETPARRRRRIEAAERECEAAGI